jgi:hypothetical protein
MPANCPGSWVECGLGPFAAPQNSVSELSVLKRFGLMICKKGGCRRCPSLLRLRRVGNGHGNSSCSRAHNVLRLESLVIMRLSHDQDVGCAQESAG